MIGIYIIKCLQENKVYIGSSKDISRRWINHKTALNNERHGNCELQLAWDAYGDESFIFDILEETEDIVIREQYWLDTYKDSLYNSSTSAWNPMQNPDNIKKAMATKLQRYGKLSASQKLDEATVLAIIKDINDGAKIDKTLSNKYAISRKTLYNIKTGKTWKHLYPLILDKRTADEIKEDLFTIAKELRATGISKGKIAKELGVSNITLYNWGLE